MKIFLKKLLDFIKVFVVAFLLYFLITALSSFISGPGETPIGTLSWWMEGYFLHYIIYFLITLIPLILVFIFVKKNFLGSMVIYHIIFFIFYIFICMPYWTFDKPSAYVIQSGFMTKVYTFFEEIIPLF